MRTEEVQIGRKTEEPLFISVHMEPVAPHARQIIRKKNNMATSDVCFT